MPCYDPPMPWEGDARKSAEDAVRLLCGLIAAVGPANQEAMPLELLAWFIGHRRIDLQIAKHWPQDEPPESIARELLWLEDIWRARVQSDSVEVTL